MVNIITEFVIDTPRDSNTISQSSIAQHHVYKSFVDEMSKNFAKNCLNLII
jgi:hypothetical protein